MNNHEEAIKLEMRLNALEYLLSKLYVAHLRSSGLSLSELSSHLDQFAKDAAKQIFPGLDPAFSDLASAEWEEAITRLVKMQKEMLAQK